MSRTFFILNESVKDGFENSTTFRVRLHYMERTMEVNVSRENDGACIRVLAFEEFETMKFLFGAHRRDINSAESMVAAINETLNLLKKCTMCNDVSGKITELGPDKKAVCNNCLSTRFFLPASSDLVAMCAICQEDLNIEGYTSLPAGNPSGACQHLFHERCMDMYLRKRQRTGPPKCPSCRADWITDDEDEEDME